jgi:hypothetical protein
LCSNIEKYKLFENESLLTYSQNARTIVSNLSDFISANVNSESETNVSGIRDSEKSPENFTEATSAPTKLVLFSRCTETMGSK